MRRYALAEIGRSAKSVKHCDVADPDPGFVMLNRELANALATTLTGEMKHVVQHLRAWRGVLIEV